MKLISTPSRNEIAELAYFYFLERRRLGLPDDPGADWERAEGELRNRTPETVANPTREDSVPLTHIRGIGPRVASALQENGVESANDLATWSLSDFGERLPRLTARARNGKWIEQAKSLTS